MALTPKQQAFVDAYAGNGVEAARAAGYQGSAETLAVTASRLLRDARITEGIAKRNALAQAARADAAAQAGRIATRAERQAFWTAVMLDVDEEMATRLKASELLGKSEADFKERIEHDVTQSFASLLAEAQLRERGP